MTTNATFPIPRSMQIGSRLAVFGWAWLRLRRRSPEQLPERLRATLEGLGTTFIKLGQGLSLRRDVLPPGYQEALSRLHDHVQPFDSDAAVATVEAAFGASLDSLFAEFDRTPFAAASVAQLHRARMPDGTIAAVKVRRPGIAAQVRADLRLLRRITQVLQFCIPGLRRQQPLELIDELATQLLAEIDLGHEARNMRRLAMAIEGEAGLTMPRVIEPLVAPDALVQLFSPGTPVTGEAGAVGRAAIAGRLLDAYLYQLFVAGVFHGDPHPGNIFLMSDGRLCLHDFGLIGYLDEADRRSLGLLVDAVSRRDAGDTLDAVVALGFLVPPLDRRGLIRAISEILDELGTMPLAEWSLAETIWRIARLAKSGGFRLPRHLLVLLRALFLVEHTIRLLDPDFDLMQELDVRRGALARTMSEGARRTGRGPLVRQVALTAQALPGLVADLLRQTRAEDGGLRLTIRHDGLQDLELHLGRTGNRLSLALVTLGLYVAGSVLMLHSAGPRIWGDLPVLAVAVFALAVLLSLRLVLAIARSGRL